MSAPGNQAPGASQPSHKRKYTLKTVDPVSRQFDFTSLRPPGPKTTVVQSIAHLIKSCLGGGIVAMHQTYSNCGLWLALLLNFVLGFLVAYWMVVLAKSAQRVYGRTGENSLSYPEVAEAALVVSKYPRVRKWARALRFLVDFTIMLDLFGSCCCYQVIIGNQAVNVLHDYTSIRTNVRVIIAILWIPCILICMILTLKYLAPFSLVADIVIVLVAFATVYYGSKHAVDEKRSPVDMPFWKGNILKVFQYIGGCVFSMEGVGVTLPVENSMINPKKITLVLSAGMSVVVAMVIMVGFFGYWGWGDEGQSPVTVNFPKTWLTLILKVTLPLMIYVTFALNFWVPFKLAWAYLEHGKLFAKMDIKKKERIIRAIFVSIITLISIIFPDIKNLISCIGAFCLSNMGFIYPAIIELVLDLEEPGLGKAKWRLIRFVLNFIFALFLMILGTYESVSDLIANFNWSGHSVTPPKGVQIIKNATEVVKNATLK